MTYITCIIGQSDPKCLTLKVDSVDDKKSKNVYTACTEINLVNTALGPSVEVLFIRGGGTSSRRLEPSGAMGNYVNELR